MTSKILIASILLITPQLSLSARSASPVYEVINEQERIDDKIRISNSPGILPYGNPLAGNQNARMHFNNQQAMFNAERIRQLTAQLQRQARGPKMMDSYMQAYQESQDSHQVALEQQQAIRNPQPITRDSFRQVTQSPVRRNKYEDHSTQGSFGSKTSRMESSRKIQRPEVMRDGSRKIRPDVMRITKADAKDVRYRNHRSYGSVEYHQYLEPQKYKTVYLAPAPTYDQGVTIKPNGNIGIAEESNQNKLLTEAISSDIKHVYPKQYQQMQNYKSIQELQGNVLTNSLQETPEHYIPSDNTNGAPIDLYFYLKSPSLPESYDQYRYAQLSNSYPSGHQMLDAFKDYKPITEEVDDIENPDAKNPKAYTAIPPAATKPPSQMTNVKQSHIQEDNKQENKPISQAVSYYQPYYEDEKDESKKYLHNEAENTGVQHLTEDGTGVSAYGDDNLQYAANYEFGYRVHDDDNGNYFGHSEAKKGENTDGHYHVLLPDGRMQKVRYHAGPGGFHADITYDHVQ